jgi:cytochrome oxidase Cu insertion factor (SCO1/SenC/PrrC family)
MRHTSLVATAIVVMSVPMYGCHRQQACNSQPEHLQLAAVALGQIAPDIDGEDMEGQRLHLADYKGNVVVLHFWANW